MSRFRIATRDELLWRGRVVESRLSHGEAIDDGDTITATDHRDEDLVSGCHTALAELRAAAAAVDARVRLVAEARNEDDVVSTSATMTIRLDALSVVTTPEHASRDYELLREVASIAPAGPPIAYRGVPVVWRNGSAAVLLHEAVGHASEHGHARLELPDWLEVDVPLRMRRATFRDVPLQRMTHVLARQTGAPFELPSTRIEVLLVGGGTYEPLTETISLQISAADFVDGADVRRLPPFELVETRAAVSRAFEGADGDTVRYPGVVCSREGQELVVDSAAPVVVTVFR